MLDHFFTGLRQIVTFCICLAVAIACARVFAPQLWQHATQAEAAFGAVRTQASALAADGASAGNMQAACLSAASTGVRAGKTIARVSQPVKQTGQDQPMITAKDIGDALP